MEINKCLENVGNKVKIRNKSCVIDFCFVGKWLKGTQCKTNEVQKSLIIDNFPYFSYIIN